jgi:hypothetical protein
MDCLVAMLLATTNSTFRATGRHSSLLAKHPVENGVDMLEMVALVEHR